MILARNAGFSMIGQRILAGKLIHFDKKSNKWEDRAEVKPEQGSLQPRLKSIEFLECIGHAQRRRSRSAGAPAAPALARRMRRVLGIVIWNLFGIWCLKFGI